jgi:hypothetical protein
VVEPERPQAIWRTRIACWMSKATRAHTEMGSIAFPRQQWFRERASVIRHTYIACLVNCVTSCGGGHCDNSPRAPKNLATPLIGR